MKKYIYVFALLIFAALGFNACTDDTEDLKKQIAELQQALSSVKGDVTDLKGSKPETVDLSSIEAAITDLQNKLQLLENIDTPEGTDLSDITSQLTSLQKQIDNLTSKEPTTPDNTIAEQLTDLQTQLAILAATNGHAYVDLGLRSGTLWATCNIGAKYNKPEDYGNYYAWGELEGCDKNGTPTSTNNPKTTFSWDTYFDSTDGQNFTKYNQENTELDLSDDVAHGLWGGNWRMPSQDQLRELRQQCYWQWVEQYNNVNVKGLIVYKANDATHKGKINTYTTSYDVSKDAHIFLPAAGYFTDNTLKYEGDNVYYYSRLYTNTNQAYILGADKDRTLANDFITRRCGLPVRAVFTISSK